MTPSEGIATATKDYGMPRKLFFRVMFLKEGLWPVAICLLLVILGIFLAIFIDWLWFVGSLLLLFLALPMILMFLYFACALKPLTLQNTSTHAIKEGSEGLEILLTDTSRVTIVPYSEIVKPQLYGNAIIISTSDRRKGWLWLPADAFDREDGLSIFIKRLNERIGSGEQQNSEA